MVVFREVKGGHLYRKIVHWVNLQLAMETFPFPSSSRRPQPIVTLEIRRSGFLKDQEVWQDSVQGQQRFFPFKKKEEPLYAGMPFKTLMGQDSLIKVIAY